MEDSSAYETSTFSTGSQFQDLKGESSTSQDRVYFQNAVANQTGWKDPERAIELNSPERLEVSLYQAETSFIQPSKTKIMESKRTTQKPPSTQELIRKLTLDYPNVPRGVFEYQLSKNKNDLAKTHEALKRLGYKKTPRQPLQKQQPRQTLAKVQTASKVPAVKEEPITILLLEYPHIEKSKLEYYLWQNHKDLNLTRQYIEILGYGRKQNEGIKQTGRKVQASGYTQQPSPKQSTSRVASFSGSSSHQISPKAESAGNEATINMLSREYPEILKGNIKFQLLKYKNDVDKTRKALDMFGNKRDSTPKTKPVVQHTVTQPSEFNKTHYKNQLMQKFPWLNDESIEMVIAEANNDMQLAEAMLQLFNSNNESGGSTESQRKQNPTTKPASKPGISRQTTTQKTETPSSAIKPSTVQRKVLKTKEAPSSLAKEQTEQKVKVAQQKVVPKKAKSSTSSGEKAEAPKQRLQKIEKQQQPHSSKKSNAEISKLQGKCQFKSKLRLTPMGPDATLKKGPDPTLRTTRIKYRGPNPMNRCGPQESFRIGPIPSNRSGPIAIRL